MNGAIMGRYVGYVQVVCILLVGLVLMPFGNGYAQDSNQVKTPNWYTSPRAGFEGQTILACGSGYGKSEALVAAICRLDSFLSSLYGRKLRTAGGARANAVRSDDQNTVGRIKLSVVRSAVSRLVGEEVESQFEQVEEIVFSGEDVAALIKHSVREDESGFSSWGSNTFQGCSWLDIEKELNRNNIHLLVEQQSDHCFVGLLMKQELVEQFYDPYRQLPDSVGH